MSKRSSTYSSLRSKTGAKHIEIFDKFSREIDDEYWSSIFQECANCKFPRYISYKEGNLIYKVSGKIKDRLDKLTIENIINFLRKYASLNSDADLKKDQILLDNSRMVDSKKNKTGGIDIQEFSKLLVKKHKIKSQSWEEIYTLINIHRLNKNISEKDIYYDDNLIYEIKGLYIEDNMVHFKKSLKIIPANKYTKRVPKKLNTTYL